MRRVQHVVQRFARDNYLAAPGLRNSRRCRPPDFAGELVANPGRSTVDRGLAPRTTRHCPTARPYAAGVRSFAIRPGKNSRKPRDGIRPSVDDHLRQREPRHFPCDDFGLVPIDAASGEFLRNGKRVRGQRPSRSAGAAARGGFVDGRRLGPSRCVCRPRPASEGPWPRPRIRARRP